MKMASSNRKQQALLKPPENNPVLSRVFKAMIGGYEYDR
jgi:hypothetical protein